MTGDRRGFTLVEMLVAMAIFAVVTGFVMANFRAGSQGDELRLASNLIAAETRLAQTYATAGRALFFCRGGTNADQPCPYGTNAECQGGVCVKEVPTGGYGIHFSTVAGEERTAIIFADLNKDGFFQAHEEVRRTPVSPDVFVSVFALEPPTGASYLDIVFVPPRPTVTFNGAKDVAKSLVTVRHRATQQTKSVSVNRISGQINVD